MINSELLRKAKAAVQNFDVRLASLFGTNVYLIGESAFTSLQTWGALEVAFLVIIIDCAVRYWKGL